MTENRKIRLIQVAKEFKVGINTIVDSLLKKGVSIDGSPNSQVSPEVYAILEKEFGSNRTSGNERNIIKEKISLGKKESVSLEAGKTTEGTIQVINPNDSVNDLKYKAYVAPYGVVGEGYEADPQQGYHHYRGRGRRVIFDYLWISLLILYGQGISSL